MAEKIEHWPLDRLKPYDKNPRVHPQEQIDQIAASITEFGFNSPILVSSQEGIIAGHGRYAAAQLLGMEKVPVVPLDHLSPAQQRAYVIADNRIALSSTWDRNLLAEELNALAGEFEATELGFSDDDMKRLSDALNLQALEDLAGGLTVQAEPEAGDDEGTDAEEGDSDEDADAEEESGETYFSFSVSMTFEDREEVFAAIRLAKERLQIDSTPNALLHICKEFTR